MVVKTSEVGTYEICETVHIPLCPVKGVTKDVILLESECALNRHTIIHQLKITKIRHIIENIAVSLVK